MQEPPTSQTTVDGLRCRVVESLGYNPDIGLRVSIVRHQGQERKAVYVGPREWRFWTPRDRAQPLIDRAQRETAAGRKYP